jgi:hypothetical protein
MWVGDSESVGRLDAAVKDSVEVFLRAESIPSPANIYADEIELFFKSLLKTHNPCLSICRPSAGR